MAQQMEQAYEEQQGKKPFNPNSHLIQIKSGQKTSDYLPVQWRLVWVNDAIERAAAEHSVELKIDTTLVHLDTTTGYEAEIFVWNAEKRRSEKVLKSSPGICVCEATVTLKIGSTFKSAKAIKSEKGVDFPDYIEKAGTGAVGRALAMIGYGTQFTGNEFTEGQQRIVDSPVNGHTEAPSTNGSTPSTSTEERAGDSPTLLSTEPDPSSAASEQQMSSIRKLCQALGKAGPTSLTYAEATTQLKQLSAELRERRTKAS